MTKLEKLIEVKRHWKEDHKELVMFGGETESFGQIFSCCFCPFYSEHRKISETPICCVDKIDLICCATLVAWMRNNPEELLRQRSRMLRLLNQLIRKECKKI